MMPAETACTLGPDVKKYLLSLWTGPDRWYRNLFAHDDWLILVQSNYASREHVLQMTEIGHGLLQMMSRQNAAAGEIWLSPHISEKIGGLCDRFRCVLED